MPHEEVTEEAVRRACLEAAARGEPISHILDEYLHVNFVLEQEASDRAASHRTEDEPGEWWIAAGARPAAGRHRAVS
mgnify:CR=1 FL=1